MEKIVKTGRTAVFTLDGTECRLTFAQKYRGFDIENRSDGDILVSFRSGSVEGDDETMTIPAGGSFNFMQMYETDTIYLTGTGKVAVAAKNDSNPNFKSSQGGGDSGTASGSVVGLQIEKYVDEPVSGDIAVSNLPYNFNYGATVVFNNEIHILGGRDNTTKHYKYNGTSWEEVSTLPYNFVYGAAVMFNNEIHILGGRDNTTKHYKYNGTSWESVSTLPYDFYSGSTVVLNNEIHILGSSSNGQSTKHYKYNGSSWEEVSVLPYNFYGGAAVALGNRIYIIGSSDSNGKTKCCYYNSSTSEWSNGYTLPYDFYYGSAVVLKYQVHILRGNNHYVMGEGGAWESVSTLLLPVYFCNAACVLNGEIYYITDSSTLCIVKNDNRHIATMLPKGAHIMLSDNEDINYVKNAEKVSSNIAEVTKTGYVEVLASMPEIYAAKGYLTFY